MESQAPKTNIIIIISMFRNMIFSESSKDHNMNNRTFNPTDQKCLTGQGVCVKILNRPILHEIHFDMQPRTITGLLGPNGCGKTTLLRAISGYLPYEGSILLKNKEIYQWPTRALSRQISFVRQSPMLTFDFTVEELVLLGLIPHKSLLQDITSEDRDLLRQALNTVGLSSFAKRPVDTLSGGERQRAYLAQAILQDSDILLFDEPTTHLDICHQYQLLEFTRRVTERGKTVLAVFHDLELASKFSDQLIVLKEGAMVASGPAPSILNDQLLADVFRMRAKINFDQNGDCKIYYKSAL